VHWGGGAHLSRTKRLAKAFDVDVTCTKDGPARVQRLHRVLSQDACTRDAGGAARPQDKGHTCICAEPLQPPQAHRPPASAAPTPVSFQFHEHARTLW
jgi:hypothetical protein